MQSQKMSTQKNQEAHSRSFSLQGSQKLANPPKKVSKSFEESVMEKEISTVEKQRLQAVYEYICSIGQEPQAKFSEIDKGFTASNLALLFQQLDYYISKHETDIIIWEVDEDSDGSINKYEFELMYKRCIFDKTGLEPKNLFNMVQFLMYDKQMKGRITVEDTLELLYVRVGRYNLDYEITSIFGAEDKNIDGQEKTLNFKEYLEKMRKKDFSKRKELEMDRKTVKAPLPEKT